MYKIKDANYLLSYFKEKYDEWYVAKGKERIRIESIVFNFVNNNLDDTIYAKASGGSGSGLCTPSHFEDDIISIINVLEEMTKNVKEELDNSDKL